MEPEIEELARRVQHNCHISDAHFARNYTLCIYLLKMREYYRWEKGYSFSDPLSHEAVGAWLTEREALWEDIEEEDFAPLPFAGRQFDPFEDAAELNRRLGSAGLVYEAGLGNHGKPLFFLGERVEAGLREGARVVVSGHEIARDITAPPAMSRDGAILVRKESLRRMLWERVEEWDWHQRENAMSRAMAHYPFTEDTPLALDRMTANETETVILHELGELAAGERLGPEWEEMLLNVAQTRAEHILRAVRDHLADSLSTLPTLLDRGPEASLHFYFANLVGIRGLMFPSLAEAYQKWAEGGRFGELERTVAEGRDYWSGLAEELLALDGAEPGELARRVEDHTAGLLA